MPATTRKRAPIAAIAAPVASLALVGIAIALPAVGDASRALLHDAFIFFSTASIGIGFSPATSGIIAVVLFSAGVVSGLSGFAFSAIAASVLWLLPALQAVPLIMLLSACNQLLSLGALRETMVLYGRAEREGALPYIAGGLAGIPVGLALLQALPASMFAGGLGLFLIVYSAFVLLKPDSLRIRLSGWKPAIAVGAAGGVIGGFSAFPVSIPLVYLGLRGAKSGSPRHHPTLHSGAAADFTGDPGTHAFGHLRCAILVPLAADAPCSAFRLLGRHRALPPDERGQFFAALHLSC